MKKSLFAIIITFCVLLLTSLACQATQPPDFRTTATLTETSIATDAPSVSATTAIPTATTSPTIEIMKFSFSDEAVLVSDPTMPNTLYFYNGYASLIYKSVDGGNVWGTIHEEQILMLPHLVINKIASHRPIALDHGRLTILGVNAQTPVSWYGLLDSGSNISAVKSIDNGKNWSNINLPTNGNQLAAGYDTRLLVSPYQKDTLYLVSFSQIYKSSDGGKNWQESMDGIANAPSGFYRPLFIFKPTQTIFFLEANGHGPYRSLNAGKSWEIFKLPFRENSVRGFDSVWKDTNCIYLLGQELYQSDDDGNTWKTIKTDLKIENSLISFAVDFHETQTMYAILGGPEHPDGSLFRSQDGGNSWIKMNAILQP